MQKPNKKIAGRHWNQPNQLTFEKCNVRAAFYGIRKKHGIRTPFLSFGLRATAFLRQQTRVPFQNSKETAAASRVRRKMLLRLLSDAHVCFLFWPREAALLRQYVLGYEPKPEKGVRIGCIFGLKHSTHIAPFWPEFELVGEAYEISNMSYTFILHI